MVYEKVDQKDFESAVCSDNGEVDGKVAEMVV